MAVAAVVVYHFVESALPGGFLGVDLFFVLSGYLITSLLLVEHATSGRIALGGFWARRARRLLPAAVVMVVAVAVAGWALPGRFPGLSDDALASLAYVANWHFVLHNRSYFSEFEAASPLRHVWSLSIEEQFYVLWPLLVAGVLGARGGGRRPLFVVAGAGLMLSVASSAWLHGAAGASRAHFGTDTRAHELLVGAQLALLGRGPAASRVAAWAPRLAPIAFSVVLVGMAVVPDGTSAYYRGFSVLFASASAVVISAVHVRPDSRLARALSVAPLTALGRISYGVYLWHWPVRVVVGEVRLGLGKPLTVALDILVTVVISLASYVVVERPIRRSRARVRTTAACAIAATAGAFAIVLHLRPDDLGDPFAHADTLRLGYALPGQVRLPPADPAARLRVGVAGDSVAASLHLGVARHGRGRGWQVGEVAVPGCGVTGVYDPRTKEIEGCGEATVALQEEMVERFQPNVVLVHSRYELYDFVEPTGEVREAGTPAHRERVRELYEQTLRRLTARGATVVYVDPLRVTESFCAPGDDSALCRKYAGWESRIEAYGRLFDDAGRLLPGRVVRVSIDDVLCYAALCPNVVDGLLLRPDGNHFTVEGGAWWTEKVVERAEAKGVSFAP